MNEDDWPETRRFTAHDVQKAVAEERAAIRAVVRRTYETTDCCGDCYRLVCAIEAAIDKRERPR